ncbi:Pantothenate transporter liz1 [Fusarium oxysporum f. sp. albedinis]|nr:Pantothenate transporter liz1 [Fusarium oxysporum f. sp. albedinis]
MHLHIYHPWISMDVFLRVKDNERTTREDSACMKWPEEMHHHITSHCLAFSSRQGWIRSAHRRLPRCVAYLQWNS